MRCCGDRTDPTRFGMSSATTDESLDCVCGWTSPKGYLSNRETNLAGRVAELSSLCDVASGNSAGRPKNQMISGSLCDQVELRCNTEAQAQMHTAQQCVGAGRWKKRQSHAATSCCALHSTEACQEHGVCSFCFPIFTSDFRRCLTSPGALAITLQALQKRVWCKDCRSC